MTNPDLVVESALVSNSGPTPGTKFTLSVTVHNDGDGASGVTTLRYYWSTDTTITTSDTAVGTDTVTGLAASGSASESVELTAPSNPGTYYYGACVDAVEEESDTTNNCSSSVEVNALESQDQPQGNPDLVVESPLVSDSGPTAGTKFTLSATVRNDGDGASAPSTLRYYRSTDETITTSDTEISTNALAGIGVSGSISESVEVTAPSTPRTYYYGACVDAVEEESDETNNCSSPVEINVPEPQDQSQGYPDLTIPSVAVATSPGGTYPGGSFTFAATVRNDGDGASEATTLCYYQSTDATITTSDTEVGTDTVAGLGDLENTNESVELTAPSDPGTYYYGACVNTVEDESDTTNNCSASVQVTVQDTQPAEQEAQPPVQGTQPPVQDNPDLTYYVVAIASGPSGFAPGGNFVMIAIILNIGDGDSEASTLLYFRSTDATITTSDTEVGRDTVPELAASESSRHTLDVTLPTSPGTYYYGACVDAVAGESDTTNNCSMGGKVVVPSTPPLESVEVTPGEVTLAALGDTVVLTARVLDAEGNAISGEEVWWRSLNPDVATVDAAGVVEAVANGRAGVTASASGVSGLVIVEVYQQADSVDINPREVELNSVGATALLTLRAFDANGHEAPHGGDLISWRWRSADPNVAKVSPVPVITLEAEVQAVAAGTTTVTVTAETEDGGTLIGTATVTIVLP